MFEPGNLEFINRTALTLKPKQPFYDWLKNIEPDENFSESLQDCDIYLLPEYEELKQMETWLKKHFDKLFIEQLNNWYMDETLWPQNRTLKMFKEWFEYTLSTMVWDTETKPMEKD